jgi:hypothetical protein
VIGGGTIAPTPITFGSSPPPVAVSTRAPDAATPTPRATQRQGDLNATPELRTFTPTPSPTSTSALVADESVIPVIDIDALNATATALSLSSRLPTLTPSPDRETNLIITPNPAEESIFGGRTTPTTSSPARADDPTDTGPAPTNQAATVQQGVDVLAYCDATSFNAPAPVNLAAGSTIDIYWVWYASTEAYIQDHLNAAQYEIAIDGVPLRNIDRYRLPVQSTASDYVVYWYAPAGPLAAGEHEITYRVSWSQGIFDGYNYYGPGSTYPVEEGSCTFTVYE